MADMNASAFVISDILGPMAAGAGRAAMLLADELSDLGINVTAYTAEPQPDAEGRLCALAQARSAWVQHGCRWKWPKRCLMAQIQVAALLRKPDVIIVVGMTYLTRRLLAGPLAPRVAVWETTNANPGNKFVDDQTVRLLAKCRAMLSPSETIDRGIRATYSFKGEILRLPFWIADAPAPDRTTPGTATWDFIYVGRLDPEKGINELIDAFAEVRKTREARLAICGFGKPESFRARADTLKLGNAVSIRANASDLEVASIMRSARWQVLPSYHEGYPLSILEAFRVGVPVIATSVGSIPEMLGESNAGLLVLTRDVPLLAQMMNRALGLSASEYAMRCQAARAAFEKLSGIAAVRRQLTEVIDRLIHPATSCLVRP